jgi:hypothetical protein
VISVSPSVDRFTATVASLASDVVEIKVGLPTDAEWLSLPEAVDAAPAWHAELTTRVGDRRAAAAYLVGWIAEVPALLTGVPVVLGAPVVEVEVDDLHVRRHTDGWFDGLAIDPWSAHEPVRPLDAAAEMVHRLTAPIVETLTAELPVGASAAWGSVADSLAGHALHLARASGRDLDDVWVAAQRLLDGLESRLAIQLVRPRPLLVPWTGGIARHQTRGTCCLHHRTCADPDPRGDGYCATCPLRDEASRIERIAAYLDATAVDERSA